MKHAFPPMLFAAALGLTLPGPAAASITMPTNFVAESVTPGVTFDKPTCAVFLPDGRLLVGEKAGRVWVVQNGLKSATPFFDRNLEVLDLDDKGLLDVAVDPNFNVNHYVYFLYVVDPDSNGVDDSPSAFSRLARYQVSGANPNVVDYSTRAILFGRTWAEGPGVGMETHSIGALRWGADGSLLVSIGDGGDYTQVDKGGLYPDLFLPGRTNPNEDIGAFRAIYLGSLDGKVLRIDPATGLGYPSNPFYDGNPASVRSRVWAYGLRNPFRFTVKPGTGSTDPGAANPGTLYIQDVGWLTWEEIDVANQGGRNFGWPCFEGPYARSDYQGASPSHNDCGSFGTPDNPNQPTDPIVAYNHTDATKSIPAGFIGNATTGGLFYTGSLYPSAFRGKFFMCDYGQNWLKVLTTDGNDQLVTIDDFATELDGPVDITADPSTGDLYYVSINAGEVRHIRYTGSSTNSPPVAHAAGTPDVGVTPLTVNFSSAGTYDPDGDPMTLSWIFGDGSGATGASVQHTYPTPGTYDALLTVDDGKGGQGRASVTIVASGTSSFPTTSVVDNFNRPDGAISNGWTGEVVGLQVSNNALVLVGPSASGVAPGTYGPNQEAYFTFAATTSSSDDQDLMLKVQGSNWSDGHIEVHYNATTGQVTVGTYAPSQGWVTHGGPFGVTFQPGDRFGARAYENGTVTVYHNADPIGTTTVDGWPFETLGGRIGLTLSAASQTRVDDFGGGDANLGENTPPHAAIVQPIQGSFFHVGQEIPLQGTGSDAQDPPSALAFRWDVLLHHNNHVHFGQTIYAQNASFIAQNHEDGTGVWYQTRLMVTDTGGMSDSTSVGIYPEIDLSPAALVTFPSTPGTVYPAQYSFHLRNFGRMPSPRFRWMIIGSDGTNTNLLAVGDTAMALSDSITLNVSVPALLHAGDWTIRVTVDTLGAIYETDETNNSFTRPLHVIQGQGPDTTPPAFVLNPSVDVGGTQANVSWSTNEPTTGLVQFGTTPQLERSVPSNLSTSHKESLTDLTMGQRYYYKVSVADTAGNTITAAIDSFVTKTGPLAVGDGTPQLSSASPNPNFGLVQFVLDLSGPAPVEFAVFDIQGREVWADADRTLDKGHWELQWRGVTRRLGPANTGMYMARVTVAGRTYTRRFVLLR